MSHDVIVLGAGPAGSVVARRLAASGVRVALIGAPAGGGWEGLSERSRMLLAEEGIGERAGLLEGAYRRGGDWAGRAVEGREWLVERRLLAAALRADARAAGAQFHADVVLAGERTGGESAARGWRVTLRSGARLTAGIVVDARGRRGPERRGPLLLAMGRQFRRARPAPSGSGTHIHATDFGWCWCADQGHALWVQVVSRPRGAHPATWIRAAAAQIPGLARALADAVPVGDGVARPAHVRLGVAGGDATWWRTGDAAFALDPLSGQGVYEAVRGARLVALAVGSVLEGGDAPLAERFVRERHEDAWRRGVATAAGFYREAAGHREADHARAPFWSETAAAYEALLPEGAGTIPGVERRPVLEDGRIVERDVVVTADSPRGVWHVAGVPVVTLKNYLETAGQATVESAASALNRPQVAVASAIHWLQKTGIVTRQPLPRTSSGG